MASGVGNVAVLLRNAANNGFDRTDFNSAGSPYSLAVGDFNGDGRQDIAAANRFGNNVAVLLRNTGNSGFDAPVSFNVSNSPNSLALGDFNADNLQDLVTANVLIGANNVSVLQGVCNNPPTFTGVTNQNRPQGTSSNAQIATVTDDITAAGSLNVQKESAEILLSFPENVFANGDDVVLIPILLNNETGKAISAYSFAVRFDPQLLQPESSAIETANSLSQNGFMIVSDTNEKGRIGIAASALNNSVSSSGTLIYLRFRAVNSTNDISKTAFTLSFETIKKGNISGMFEDEFGNRIFSSATNGLFSIVDGKSKK